MIRKSYVIPLLLSCWLAYFTVPVINNVGVFNGIYVMLCATKGVMIHEFNPPTSIVSHAHHQSSHNSHHHAQSISSDGLEPQARNAENHEAEDCPCIHFFFDTAPFLAIDMGFVKALASLDDTHFVSPISPIYSAFARGPPTVHRTSHLLKPFT